MDKCFITILERVLLMHCMYYIHFFPHITSFSTFIAKYAKMLIKLNNNKLHVLFA